MAPDADPRHPSGGAVEELRERLCRVVDDLRDIDQALSQYERHATMGEVAASIASLDANAGATTQTDTVPPVDWEAFGIVLDPPEPGTSRFDPIVAVARDLDAPQLEPQSQFAPQPKVMTPSPRRSLPACSLSLISHVVGIGLLSLIRFVTICEQPPKSLWLATVEATEADVSMAEFATVAETVEMLQPDTNDDRASQVDHEEPVLQDVQPPPLGDLAVADVAIDWSENAAMEDQPQPHPKEKAPGLAEDDVGGDGFATVSAAGATEKSTRKSNNGPQKPLARFFGAKAAAERIVFVVDNSNSMSDGRFETALMEIAASVERLTPQQRFFVYFYSDAVYPLYYPESADDFQLATRDNRQRLKRWLGTVEMCTGGKVLDAMQAAAKLNPDVIYLLSDGVIQSPRALRELTAREERSYVVHTLGMTVPDPVSAAKLVAIAQAHGGVFQPVGIAPLARQLAQQRPIPRHHRRGPIWGINLER